MIRLSIPVLSVFAMLAVLTPIWAEDVIYENPIDLSVRGHVVDSPDGLFRVFPEELDLDVNRDGVSDLRFRHSLTPRSERIDAEALRLMRFAEEGIRSSLDIVRGMRPLVIEAANEGVNDKDALARIQAQIDNGLDFMDRKARAPFDERPVLDGSYGMQAISANRHVVPISATIQTEPGDYAVEVITAGQRANISFFTAQTSALASDETLVINGVSVQLFENLTQSQVIDRINDFHQQTGVRADTHGQDGSTRLYTEAFGAEAQLCVVSNLAASASSSGVGNTKQCDTGVDVELGIGGSSYTGAGATVTATSGPEKGLSLRIAEDFEIVTTAMGVLGSLSVVDNSPVFVTNRKNGDSIKVQIPNVKPEALGQGVHGNPFSGLHAIRALSAAQANDSLAIIDHAWEELREHHEDILDFLAINALPYGMGTLEGLNGAAYSLADVGLLPAGVRIGPDLNFEDGKTLLQESSVFREIEQHGFLGARVPVRNGWIYGWIGVEVAGDSSLTISDYAWNLLPNETVVTGVASNRTLDSLLPGDANLDGIVGFRDFLICSTNFGQPGRWHHGDFNFDQRVDFDDFLMLSTNFDLEATSISVPEPSAGNLLVYITILIASAWARRTRTGARG